MPEPRPAPFASDIDYIEAESAWIAARCRRLDLERRLREIDEPTAHRTTVVGRVENASDKELERRLPALRAEEESLRGQIDARLQLNRTVGPKLGLDAIAEEHRLDTFERGVLMVAAVAALGSDHADPIDRVAPRAYCGGAVTPEAIWSLLEMPEADRLRSRVALLPHKPLLGAGLVTVSVGASPTPGGLPSSAIELTSAAFAMIVGVLELARCTGEPAREP